MKRIIVFAIACILLIAMIAGGCSSQNNQPTQSAPATLTPVAGGIKTGLGTYVTIGKSQGISKDAEGKPVDALAQSDAIMAAVTLDPQGRIINVKIDNAQVKINFDEKGSLITDTTAVLKTKVELGNDYGMKKGSSIGKEWFEEIAALEDWMKGKTIDQVMAMKTYKKDDEHLNVPQESDLTSSVTLSVEGYLAAVKKAADNAKDFGAAVNGVTKTGLGSVISISKSKGVAIGEDKNPANALGETDVMMAALTLDDQGKIVGVMMDSAQVQINFDATGALVTDTSKEVKSKVELGDAYGMKKASSIGKEWYEEIAALGQWMVGKTVDQVAGMKLSQQDDTHPNAPQEADLTSSVTFSVQDFITAVQKAAQSAD